MSPPTLQDGMVVMPELGREIRRRRPELRIVLTTGFSEAAARMQSGEFVLLPKPYSAEALARALGVG